jgi:glycosyltransferase involved in cell wall biosynthesis
MRVVVRAPLLSVSGYGHHSRQVYEAAKLIPNADVFTQVVQWGNTSWLIDSNAENGIVGEIMKRTTDQQTGFDVSFQVQLPDEWDPNLAKINIGVTAAVETDVCNPVWIERCNGMNAIIVPSKFTEQVLRKTGNVTVPVYVIPEWFMPEILASNFDIDFNFKTPFNFLIVSQLTATEPSIDRKNIFNTIKWIQEAFEGDNKVGIIIKTNSGRGTTLDHQMTGATLKSIISQIQTRTKLPVYFVHGNMSNEEVVSLYRHPTVKALVSLTRGEGFGLPLLEAATSGLPVIATDWSAHTEFLNHGKWIKIENDLVQIPESRADGRIFIKGSKWSNPREDMFKRKIKKFRDSHEIPTQWAKELKDVCREKLSKDSVLKIYASVINEIIKR